ncbi:MAG: tetratricopeptide repeat protein [Thermomicrobiales bacterium]
MTTKPFPQGRVTFLVTDIEGSTRLWERDTEVMWRAVERHNAILSEAIRRRQGSHFKTIGDAYQAAFADPAQAIAAVVDAQRALAAEPWPETGPIRVRMALHLGEATPSPAGDYQAPALSRVNRIISAGFGGQVIVSEAMHAASVDHLPAGVSFQPLGRHRLRDLLQPETIWQLSIPGLPQTFPPLKSLETFPNNLPAQPAPLIGRDAEVQDLVQLLADPAIRLLTLTGPGGVGKTRLALAAAAEAQDLFPHGAFLVAMAGLEDAALLLPEIATTLGVREGGGLTLEQSVVHYLTGKQVLLVLDNLEQLRPLDDAASVVSSLLEQVPTLRVLGASRAPLRVRAEREWPVEPLQAPGAAAAVFDDAALADLAANPAVALFLDRARAARPAWTLLKSNAGDVAELVRRLDGLPLAIELAAARVRVMTPAAIVERLGGALDVLATEEGGRPDRQATLRGAINWSHDLLSFEHQAALRRLGVFAGGFTLEAAETVLAESPDPWIDGLDAVAILAEQSLIRTETDRLGETRYQMLETIRSFAREHLTQAGEEDPVHLAHGNWVSTVVQDIYKFVLSPEAAHWLDVCEREHDNIRSALTWALDSHNVNLGANIADRTWRFWEIRGHYTEGRTWLERCLEAFPEALPRQRALLLDGLGNIVWKQGDVITAARVLEDSLAIWRETGEEMALNAALSNLGAVMERLGNLDRAEALQREALLLARQFGDEEDIALTLNNLATVLWNKGDLVGAEDLLEESLVIKRRIGNLFGLAVSLTNLAILTSGRGNLDQGISYMEEALSLDRQLGNLAGIADSLGNLGSLVAKTGDLARAAQLDGEALEIRRELGDSISIAYGLESIGSTTARAGRHAEAMRFFGAANHLREKIAVPLPPSEQENFDSGTGLCRAALSPEAYAAAWEAGRAMPLDEAITLALQVTAEVAATPPADGSATP